MVRVHETPEHYKDDLYYIKAPDHFNIYLVSFSEKNLVSCRDKRTYPGFLHRGKDYNIVIQHGQGK